MKPYRVSYPQGGCTIIYARTARAAGKEGKRIFDRNSLPVVVDATEDDVEWVKMMGGRIHNEPLPTPSPSEKKGMM